MTTTTTERLRDDLTLRALQPNTIDAYLRCIGAFERFHSAPASALGEEEVRAFLLDLVKRGRKPSTVNVYYAALTFLYVRTLKRPEVVEDIPRPRPRRPRRW